MMNIRKSLFFLTFFWLLSFLTHPLYAACNDGKCDSPEEYSAYAQELNAKINDLSKTRNTLSNQIILINSQIQLTTLKISQTQDAVNQLIIDISDLSGKITNLDINLNQLSSIYINQIAQNYKLQKRLPQFSVFLFGNFNNFLEQYKYLSVIQKNSQNTLVSLETNRTILNQQKEEKKKKQNDLIVLQKQLASQKSNLASQINSKNKLLEITKNDEKKYQLLLVQVQSKLASFNNSSAGCLDSPAGGGSDGNFYSQIDSRWCKQFIGLQTKYTIGGAGCYLTSMSIILKKVGTDINPSQYASDISRFASTADLVDPQVPAGYTYKKYGYSSNIIDNELKNGRYVIAQVPMRGSPSGFHFVVIISGSSGNYKMHDPVYGADKNLSDYYSTSKIVSLRLITK